MFLHLDSQPGSFGLPVRLVMKSLNIQWLRAHYLGQQSHGGAGEIVPVPKPVLAADEGREAAKIPQSFWKKGDRWGPGHPWGPT